MNNLRYSLDTKCSCCANFFFFLRVSLLFRKLLRTGIFSTAACKSSFTSKSWRAASSTRWSQWNSANTFECVSDNVEGCSVNWLHVSREDVAQVSMWPSSHFSLNQVIVYAGVYGSIHSNRFKKMHFVRTFIMIGVVVFLFLNLYFNECCLSWSSEWLLQLRQRGGGSAERVRDGGNPGVVLWADCHAAPRCSVLRHLRHVLQPGQEGAASRWEPEELESGAQQASLTCDPIKVKFIVPHEWLFRIVEMQRV